MNHRHLSLLALTTLIAACTVTAGGGPEGDAPAPAQAGDGASAAPGSGNASSGDGTAAPGSDPEAGDGSIDGSVDRDGAAIADAATDGAVGTNDPCGAPSQCPDAVRPLNLQLWLRADTGVQCTNGRVAQWADQSTYGRHAVPAPARDGAGKALAPQCGVDTLNGRPVLTFTAPPVAPVTDGRPRYFGDETLSVDLAFLGQSDITVFAVEKRSTARAAQGILSLSGWTSGLYCKDVDNRYFELGYLYDYQYDARLFGERQGCVKTSALIRPFDAAAPAQLSVFTFDDAVGKEVFINGVSHVKGNGSDADKAGIVGFPKNGVIGRGTDASGDSRYTGVIAELIAFNAALTPAERTSVEAYLKRRWGLTY